MEIFNFITKLERSKKLPLLALLFLLIALPVALYQVFTTQNIHPKAAENSIKTAIESPLPKESEYVKGEIIVRFKPSVLPLDVKTDKKTELSLDKDTILYSDLDPNQIPKSLSNLHQKQPIQKIEKIFKGKSDPQTELAKIKNKFAQEISDGKRSIDETELLKIDLSRIYKIVLPEDAPVKEVINDLKTSSEIEYAELNYVLRPLAFTNDSLANYQWALDNTGQTGGTVDADIDIPEAWGISRGSAQTIIAIIDTGVDYTHPDLVGNLWTNSNEIPSNGKDDDGNGYIDDYYGWNFANGNNNPMDHYCHGTNVAGITAAVTGNSQGIAGICPNCKIMIIQTAFTWTDAGQAVSYAIDNGARVINASWGGIGYSQSFQDIINWADAHGVLFIAAAGNSNTEDRVYPAAFNKVLSVAATTKNDTKAGYSTYGTWVDVSAPGGQTTSGECTGRYNNMILTPACSDNSGDCTMTVNSGKYIEFSGTSAASPHAAGVAGLIFSVHPDWTPATVMEQIINTSDSIDAKNPNYLGKLGKGRINAYKALAIELNATNYNGAYDRPTGLHTFYMMVKNNTNAVLRGINISSNLPPGFTYNSHGCIHGNNGFVCPVNGSTYNIGDLNPQDFMDLWIAAKIDSTVTLDSLSCLPEQSTHQHAVKVIQDGSELISKKTGVCVESPLNISVSPPSQIISSGGVSVPFDITVTNTSTNYSIDTMVELYIATSPQLSNANSPVPTIQCSWTTDPQQCYIRLLPKADNQSQTIQFYRLPAGQNVKIRYVSYIIPGASGTSFVNYLITIPQHICATCATASSVVVKTSSGILSPTSTPTPKPSPTATPKLTPTPTSLPTPISSGLLAWWKFDETSWNGTAGQVKDSSGNNLNGQAMGEATTTTDAINNRSGSFDGVDDGVYFGNPASLQNTSAGTVTGWIKLKSWKNTESALIVKGNTNDWKQADWRITTRGSSASPQLYFCIDDEIGYTYGVNYTCITSNVISYNQWYHVALVWNRTDKSYLYAYLNGIQIGGSVSMTNKIGITKPIYIGKWGTQSGYNSNCLIDDVRIYNRALTASEISGIYNTK